MRLFIGISKVLIDWNPFVIMGNTMPPRDPDEDEERKRTAPTNRRSCASQTKTKSMMLLGLGIAGVSEIVGAFGGRKCSEDFADCDADGFGRARGRLAQQVLELGEDLFDRVQVRRVFRHRYLAIATLECAILGTTPSSSVLCGMELSDYLRDQAVMYRKLAEQADDPVVKNEMLELASVCEEVANNIEDHLTGG